MSCSISLRLVMVMLVCVAGFSAAQSFSTCPSVTSSADYFLGSNCSGFTTCATLRCLCVGGTLNSTTFNCDGVTTTGKTCDTVSPCQGAFVQCLIASASTSACMSSLKIALMNIAAGSNFNGSAIDTACQADTCRFYNTTTASNCTINYGAVCKLPSATNAPNGTVATPYIGEIGFSGNFAAIFANLTALQIFNLTLTGDEIAYFNVFVQNLKITQTSATVRFQANVANNDPAFLAKVNGATTNTAWFAKSAAAFTALGGTGSFGVTGITQVTPAPAPTQAPASASQSVIMWSALLAALVAIFA